MMWDIAWGIVLGVVLLQLIGFGFGLSIVVLAAIPAWGWAAIGGLIAVLIGWAIDPTGVMVIGGIGALIIFAMLPSQNTVLKRFNSRMETRRLGKRIV
jgi:hypothetical protein